MNKIYTSQELEQQTIEIIALTGPTCADFVSECLQIGVNRISPIFTKLRRKGVIRRVGKKGKTRTMFPCDLHEICEVKS